MSPLRAEIYSNKRLLRKSITRALLFFVPTFTMAMTVVVFALYGVAEQIRWILTAIITLITVILGVSFWRLARNDLAYKIAAEKIRKADQRLAVYIRKTPMGVIEWDRDFRVNQWNAAAEMIFGFSREEALGKKAYDLIVPENAVPEVEEVWQDLLNLRGGFRSSNYNKTKQGREIFCEWYNTPFMDENNRVIGIASLVQDITEKRRADKELKASQEKYKSIVENTRDIIILSQPDGTVLYVSPSVSNFIACRPQEFGENWIDYVHEDDRGRVRSSFAAAFNGEGGTGLNYRLITRSGETKWVNHSWSPVFRDNQLQTVVSVIHDITDLKDSEKKLNDYARMVESKRAELNKALEERTIVQEHMEQNAAQLKMLIKELDQSRLTAERASEAKSQFLANMSHEIRTPLNGIIGMTELTLDSELSAEQKENLEIVKESAYNLLAIINDILDFSKIEAGQMELEEIEFSLRTSIETALDPLAVKAHEKNLELISYVSPLASDTLLGDPGRLRQVLINMVGNAIKFTNEGEITVSVEEEAQRGNVIKFHFSIADTGIGIPRDRQAAIFESFTQADGSTTRKYGGTGLGTTISKQLVEMMGGTIWLASPTNSNKDIGGDGSTFHFTAEFKIPTRQKTTYWFKDVDLCNVRVLVVDDNRTSRRLTAFVMENWGMSTDTADSGPAAMKAFLRAVEDKRPYHLIILDSHMPDMDGFTVAAEMQKIGIPDETEIIMLTAAGVKGDAQRCRDLGITTYIHKPLKQTVLYRSIQATLNLNRGTRGENGHKDESRRRDQFITEHSLSEAGRRLKILVAEDNRVNQVMIKKLLVKHGHDVTLVGDGPSAILHQEKDSFDLILMDIQMPLMDGDKAARIIRDKEKISGGHIPIIALTAHAMAGDREKYIEAGMDGYISKPIDAVELFKTIDEIHEKYSSDGNRKPAENLPDKGTREIIEDKQEDRIFDKQAALERFDGDEELLNEIIAVFLDDYATQLKEMDDAVENGDAELIDRTAHRLKGAAGNIGAQAVVDLALELEIMGRNKEVDGVEEKYRQLKSKMRQLVEELRRNRTVSI